MLGVIYYTRSSRTVSIVQYCTVKKKRIKNKRSSVQYDTESRKHRSSRVLRFFLYVS
jgi:hypothetical protein